MRDSDAFSWYMEADPVLRANVVSVTWLDRAPDWDALVYRLDDATRRVPMFRQRVLEPPARLATPRWTVDRRFDVRHHLHRTTAPAPSPSDAVLAVARQAAMTPFDRSRPLWDFTLVEHLDGDGAALVMKLHHALTDGLGGIQLALLLFDDGPVAAPARAAARPDDDAGRPVRWPAGDLLGASLAHDGRRVAGLVVGGLLTWPPSALRAARHPWAASRELVATAASVGRAVAPVRDTRSPIMTARGLGRRLEVVDVALADLKRAAGAVGGTVNDGFLAGVTGGLRRYHQHHGAPVDELRVTLPISVRTADDPAGGNRITLLRFAVPVADPDPGRRIRAAGRLCTAARRERSVPLSNAIAGALNLLPPGTVGGMLKHVDFVASDVPGFTSPVYLGGALVTRHAAFGPTIGTAVNFTLLSYNGICSIGLTIDEAAVSDPEVLAGCVRDGFEEVLALAGPHTPARLPLRRSAAAIHRPRRVAIAATRPSSSSGRAGGRPARAGHR